MSPMQSRLEASIQQAKQEIEINIDLEKQAEPEMKSGYQLQLIEWTDRLANLIWIQTGEVTGNYLPLFLE